MNIQKTKPRPKLNFWQTQALDQAAKRLPLAQQDRFRSRVLDRLGQDFSDPAFQVALEQALTWTTSTK
jgi:hypothetical protein